ncbi:MAG: 6-phosphogluconolactonase [Vicinamibacterales bacterium]
MSGDARRPDVRICDDLADLSRRVAESVVVLINDAVRRSGRCTVALSGGNTPRLIHALLASVLRDQIPWPSVHVFWGDERYVPADDPASNYGMARATLLDHVPCPAANIHPMPTSFPQPDVAACDYERMLREYFADAWPRFDLLFLGVGEDGHTASLFPGSPALDEDTRWVVPTVAPVEPTTRLTLTLPALAGAATTCMLASGRAKRPVLERVLRRDPAARHYPVARLAEAAHALTWWVDAEAAPGATDSQQRSDTTCS